MNQLHVILRVFTVLAFVAASLPFQMIEDAHYDGNIDLKDVISAVRQFEASAINPDTFTHTVKAAVSTLEVAADLKTVITTDSATDINAASLTSLPVLLSSTIGILNLEINATEWQDSFEAFNSIDQFPPTPPPKLV